MSYLLEDYSPILIYLTDGYRDFYIPKFRLSMVVEEPYLKIEYNYPEWGGNNRKIKLNYTDVDVYGYGGIGSAQDLKDSIDAMIVSGWTDINVGDILVNKGDLLSSNGATDEILPVGTDGRILVADSGESTGLLWQDPSAIVGTKYVAIPINAANQTGAQNTTYYFGGIPSFVPQTAITRVQIPIPVAGTIKEVHLRATWGNTPSGNDHLLYIRKNNTTDTLFATTPISTAASVPLQINTTGLSIAVTTSDTIAIKWTTPTTWTTPATNLFWNGFIVIQLP